MVWGKTKGKPGTEGTSPLASAGAASLENMFGGPQAPTAAATEAVEVELPAEPPSAVQQVLQPTPAPAHRQPQPAPVDLLSAFDRAPEPVRARPAEKSASNIGPSVRIDGELSGSEDISVEGTVEGIVSLKENKLTVATKGVVRAEIQAASVAVYGKVIGNISATDVVQVMNSGSMEGDIRAGRVILADGAKFRGNIQMGWEPDKDGNPAPRSDKSATSATGTGTGTGNAGRA